MKQTCLLLSSILFSFIALTSPVAGADSLSPAMQARIDANLKQIQAWANDPIMVSAVKAQNASLPSDYAAMTQAKWKELTVLDPFVRSFTRNEVARFIKSRKSDAVSEAFLSDAAGVKIAFLGKTSNWSHKGMPKHDVPMTGKTWQGPLELDESSGTQQVQVAMPILDGDKPIGSFVVGLSLAKLKE